MRIGGRAAVGLLAGCLLVAGCSSDGGEEAVTLPPATTAPTYAPSASTTSPQPAGDEPTPFTTETLFGANVQSVDDFVSGFFTTFNSTKETRDFTVFDSLYLPRCGGCTELRTEMEGWLQEGQTVEGGDWVILQQRSTQIPDASRAGFTLLAYRTAALIMEADGSVAREVPVSDIFLWTGGLVSADPWLLGDMGSTVAPL